MAPVDETSQERVNAYEGCVIFCISNITDEAARVACINGCAIAVKGEVSTTTSGVVNPPLLTAAGDGRDHRL
jgi:hypothetical protein